MAIKVIKEGKLPKEKEMQGTCNTCGCQVKCLKKDAKYVSDQRDGDYYYIICPCCKKPIYVS